MRSVSRQAIRSLSTSFCCRKDAKTRYILSMFPYPSGRLHMGHMRVYSISDALAQYYRLNGFNVLHPIGWDSFGLPAENAARLMGVQPDQWTEQNIEVMREQLKRTGVKFDWDREISTCQPDFYKWTQWIFVKLFENNLVHRRFSSVFWDPVDQTVLAAEQIDADGRSWRSGAVAEKRKLKQWAIETPKYAKRLFDGLELIKDNWQEVASIQANWINKCDVFRFTLPVMDNGKSNGEVLDLRIIDPSELAQAEFIIVQSDHSLADQEKDNRYVSSKVVKNFLNGRELPIVFLAPNEHENHSENMFMGARIGFAAKSQYDKSLARSLGIIRSNFDKQSFTPEQIFEKANAANVGGYQTSRILRDWVVSRQRGWGTPIPIVINNDNDEHCRPVSVEMLPVLSEQRGQSMPNNGRIETDTLDTFFDSSWYYLRFLDPSNKNELASLDKISAHMPVDVYVGGIEHADVHLFFARFISYFLYDIGVTNVLEPFQRLLPQGFVRGQTFVELNTGRYVPSEDVESENKLKSKSTGKSVEMLYEKMSKSKANGVDPLDIIDRIGVDLTRLQLLGVSAPRANMNWDEDDLKGMRKWIERMQWVIETYIQQREAYPTLTKFEMVSPKRESYYRENYNYFVRNVSLCMEVLNVHNTAVARLQGLTNTLRKMEPNEAGRSIELERCVHALVIMLQIFAPNTAQKFWEMLKTIQPLNAEVRYENAQLSEQKWPQVDHDAEIDFIVSVNDTSSSRITVTREAIEHLDDEKLIQLAKQDHHSAFFKLLADRSIDVSNIRVKRHPGFYVNLNLTSSQLTDIDQLRKLISGLTSEKIRSRKEAKKQRRELGQNVK
ncbi:Aminoacyl-tRNA synthetase domain containing protein [Aphelenchoides bicaudatus]|nr:Aminoacyl-tRNA synthetase domain containing protein [Aphelenchoides bicaudatus]